MNDGVCSISTSATTDPTVLVRTETLEVQARFAARWGALAPERGQTATIHRLGGRWLGKGGEIIVNVYVR
jgi:hypothetical protein